MGVFTLKPEHSKNQGRKEHEFAERLQQVHVRLYSYIHMIVQDMDEADDVLQQTSIVLWRKYDAFDATRDFFGWACGVARLEARNFLRKRRTHRLVLSDQLDELMVASLQQMSDGDRDARREALAGCVAKLSKMDRGLLEQCYSKSVAVRDIARSLQRSPQSVHNSLKRVRDLLQDCIRRSLSLESF
ncbi:RNA polymerase sigma factor [Pirellulimonas nuda]|uniref:RNA polymerase sigma factor n=1 Tax=Pirellulimonas nuda TaxID=2528009 RepID=A0A518DHH4_9BACT|nr:sigma-70 family RNA polymerase sigma factor [Pirellulimonas nuda]QDU90926.1 RNA polymerase sigma factor [Pirellulimonas nuda]